MARRRDVLAGLLAAGFAPRTTWAEVGSPDYLTAAQHPNGAYTLCGLSHAGQIVFELPLPARGHAAAAHPNLPIAVAFARRPGRFALVLDCSSGRTVAQLEAPAGRHFYGHGTFSSDGSILFTTENDFDAGRGVIGVWDAENGFRRIAEMDSGGVGPHDLLRLPGRDDLVVANGGIETHPDTGRAKLNLPRMRPNLTYLSSEGLVFDQVELDPDLRQNSIRHLDATPSGDVAFAMQWEGLDGAHPPLLGLHRAGSAAQLISAPSDLHRELEMYVGSVAFSQDTQHVAITSPRGSVIQVFSANTGVHHSTLGVTDACGIAKGVFARFHVTTGEGEHGSWDGISPWRPNTANRAFDNHLIVL